MIAESYVGYKHRKTIGIERNVVVRAYKYHPGPRQSDTVSHKNINLAAQNTARHRHHHTTIPALCYLPSGQDGVAGNAWAWVIIVCETNQVLQDKMT